MIFDPPTQDKSNASLSRNTFIIGGAQISAGLSQLVITGQRVFTPHGILKSLKPTMPLVTKTTVGATLTSWIELKWLREFVPPKGVQRCYVVTEECPLITDLTSLRQETILALVGGHACFGYRTALTLHGLSEEMSTKEVIVCRPRRMAPPQVVLSFTRSNRPAQVWAKWEGLKVMVADRDVRSLGAQAVIPTANGLLVTTPLRSLLDCWIRPGCGISDDRLYTAWRTWLEAPGNTSRSRKTHDCAKMFWNDPDQRPGRRNAFIQFLQMVDDGFASSFTSELTQLEDTSK